MAHNAAMVPEPQLEAQVRGGVRDRAGQADREVQSPIERVKPISELSVKARD